MVGRKGWEWLNGYDAESLAKEEQKRQREQEAWEAKREEEKKKAEYQKSLPSEVDALKTEGMPKPISPAPSMGSGSRVSDNLKQALQHILDESGSTNTHVASLHTVVDTLSAGTREIADEYDSTTLGEAADQFASAMSSLTGAMEHMQEANEKIKEYLRALSS